MLKELSQTGNANVRAWFGSVAAPDIYISAMTMFENRKGWECRKKTDPVLATAKLAELDALEAAYGARLVPIDAAISMLDRLGAELSEFEAAKVAA